MGSIAQFIRYWLPVAGLCAAIFIQSSLPSPDKLPSFQFSDKLLHVLAYGLLAALICRAANSHARWRHRWWPLFFIGAIGASLYGLSDEWHQSFVASRSAEATDFVADAVGGVIGSGSFLWYLQWRSAKATGKLTSDNSD